MPRGYEPEDFLTPRDASAKREPATEQSSRDQVAREQAPDDRSAVVTQDHDRNAAPPVEPRSIHEIRGRTYRLRNSETATMLELGKFRAIAQEDLAEFAYGGDKGRMRPDIENLMRQGLVEMKSIPHEEMGSRKLFTLTKNAHRFLTETQRAGKGQVLYHGFTKPREANHDADLYRLYQNAAEKIEGQGGRNLRVVLDYEMKKRLYRDLAKLGPGRDSSKNKHLVAERHGLQVVRGKIPVPDIRIEYEAPDGERARVDLELATSHYRGRNLAEKVRAGFSIYAHAEDASKLRRVLDQRELTAEILSL
jgi:hypothetical protein